MGTCACEFSEPSFKTQFNVQIHISRPSTRNNETYNVKNGGATDLVKSKYFRPYRRTIFYIHGFGDHPFNVYTQGIVQAFFRRDDYNILSIDWAAITFGNTSLAYYYGTALPAAVRVMRVQLIAASDKLHIIFHTFYRFFFFFRSHLISQNCLTNGSTIISVTRHTL